MKNKVFVAVLAIAGFGMSGAVQAQASYQAAWQLDGLNQIRSITEFTFGSGPPQTGQWHGTFARAEINFPNQPTDEWGAHYGYYVDTYVAPSGTIELSEPPGPLPRLSTLQDRSKGIIAAVFRAEQGTAAYGEFTGDEGRVESSMQWGGHFSLNPHASVTFGATSIMSSSGVGSVPVGPLVASQTYDANQGLLELAFSGADGQLRNSLQLSLASFSGNHSDVLSYQMDAATHALSVTFTNPGESNLVAWMWAESAVNAGASVAATLASPVPEPSTWFSLMAGLGMLGFMATRRKSPGA